MEQTRDSKARNKRRENSKVRERDTKNFAELRSGEYGITESERRNIARRVQRRDPDVKEKERQEKAFLRQVRDSMAQKTTTIIRSMFDPHYFSLIQPQPINISQLDHKTEILLNPAPGR